jgi:hypothetical protein
MQNSAISVAALLATGEGTIAADKRFPTIGKRFAAFSIPATDEIRALPRGIRQRCHQCV